jgi:hypothetical protein
MDRRHDHRQDDYRWGEPPTLQFLCDMHATVFPPFIIGTLATGHRLVFLLEPGGRVEGPELHGRIMPGSTVTQLIRTDSVVEFEGQTFLEMDDGHSMLLRTSGMLSVLAEGTQELAEGKPYDPSSTWARSSGRFEAAADGPYAWLNQALCVVITRRDVDSVDRSVWGLL